EHLLEKGLGKSQLPQSSPDGAWRRRNSLILSTKPHTRGPPTFWHQGNAAPFACQEKRRPELGRAFLLPMRSLVKCIPDRPMHAGVIVMALRCVASRDIKNLQGPEPSVRPSLPRVGDRSAWPRNRLPKSPRRRACFPVSSTSYR